MSRDVDSPLTSAQLLLCKDQPHRAVQILPDALEALRKKKEETPDAPKAIKSVKPLEDNQALMKLVKPFVRRSNRDHGEADGFENF